MLRKSPKWHFPWRRCRSSSVSQSLLPLVPPITLGHDCQYLPVTVDQSEGRIRFNWPITRQHYAISRSTGSSLPLCFGLERPGVDQWASRIEHDWPIRGWHLISSFFNRSRSIYDRTWLNVMFGVKTIFSRNQTNKNHHEKIAYQINK